MKRPAHRSRYLLYYSLDHFQIAKEYNFELETSCDVEVILHLYARGGVTAAARALDGEFGFCIIDLEKNQVHIARDPFGVRPVFVLRTDNGVLGVCSEGKGKYN